MAGFMLALILIMPIVEVVVIPSFKTWKTYYIYNEIWAAYYIH